MTFSWTGIEDAGGTKGLALKSRRGPVAKTWWASQWLTEIEADYDESLHDSGKRIARKNQILQLYVNESEIKYYIKISRDNYAWITQTYQVIAPEIREQIYADITQVPLHYASIISNFLHPSISEIFTEYGVSLLQKPTFHFDGDYENPDELILAGAYLISEQFDYSPFVMLLPLGISQEGLQEKAHDIWDLPCQETRQDIKLPELEEQMANYFKLNDELPNDIYKINIKETDIMKCLGHPPFIPVDDKGLLTSLRNLYEI
ncbi:MAG: hypothetical protein HRT89_22040 [Lentisphaeria bacterium]|nr:hypothetical protein [Lentisphaeria bacterium]NQZ70744.1 hypothetical protein [Lentisphaeria bacterium]